MEIGAVAVKYKCIICGAETDWDEEFGDKPICVKCWDKGFGADNKQAARQRKYRQEHKAELAACQRKWYQEHKAELAARRRKLKNGL